MPRKYTPYADLTDEQKKAASQRTARYMQNTHKAVQIHFHHTIDADIIARLESVPNKAGYIKALIRADIAKPAFVCKGEAFLYWQANEATPEDIQLYNRVMEFADDFQDMRFENCADNIPDLDAIPDFDYTICKSKDPEGYAVASYDSSSGVLTARYDAEDFVLLHEMIHLHEDLLDRVQKNLRPILRDMLCWSFYRKLKKRIPAIDEIIDDWSTFENQDALHNAGGTHSVLFLMKSFDLDIKHGWELGTTFAYHHMVDFSKYLVE